MTKLDAKTNPISAQDYVAIQNLMGKYQWLVDDGDSEGWAALFTEDGVFAGGLPETLKGHEQLRTIPKGVLDNFQDKMRHHLGSFYVEYGSSTDEAIARYYNLVTTWMKDEGAQFFTMALSAAHVVRINGEWKIKAVNAKRLFQKGHEAY